MFLIKALSLLPTSVLYLLSDLLYFIARYMIGYRKKVIVNNLRKSFPEKSEKEIQKITGAFYLNLTDIIVETIKTLSLSKKELEQRIHFSNLELPLSYITKGQSIIVLSGHLCNWEWLLSACSLQSGFPIDAVYKPLNNESTNRLMYKIRSRFGAKPVAMKETLREQIKKKDIPHGLAMVADQTPVKNEIQFWTTFLNQDTPFYLGAEKIGKMLQMPVLFVSMRRIKRGKYEISFTEIAVPPFPEKEHYIIEKYAELLENEIRNHPSDWLWSHRRWKHKRERMNYEL